MSATDALAITSAPDALTRYYDAKEREENAVLYINDAYLEVLNSLEKLEAENTKLRDAVAVLWECCAWETDSFGWCDVCDYHDEDNGGCKVEKVLRELGIERWSR